jgi:RNA polymerase sigma factor (sigma-70 family)
VTSEELYAKYHRLVWKVARTMQKSYALADEDVEDIVSATFQRLVQLPADKRNADGYVRTVINNASRTELRHILEASRNHDPLDAKSFELSSGAQSVELALINEQEVLRVISRLSPEEHSIVCRLVGLLSHPLQTPQQIAASLNISRPQLLKRIDDIYSRLRSWLSHSQY